MTRYISEDDLRAFFDNTEDTIVLNLKGAKTSAQFHHATSVLETLRRVREDLIGRLEEAPKGKTPENEPVKPAHVQCVQYRADKPYEYDENSSALRVCINEAAVRGRKVELEVLPSFVRFTYLGGDEGLAQMTFASGEWNDTEGYKS